VHLNNLPFNNDVIHYKIKIRRIQIISAPRANMDITNSPPRDPDGPEKDADSNIFVLGHVGSHAHVL